MKFSGTERRYLGGEDSMLGSPNQEEEGESTIMLACQLGSPQVQTDRRRCSL